MSAFMPAGYRLGALLKDEGLVPEHCAEVQLHIPADDVVMLRYDVLITGEQLEKLGRALAQIGAEAKPTKG